MVYQCKRCGYNTRIKTDIIRHLKRQNKCNPCLNDIEPEIEEIYIGDIICDHCKKHYITKGNLTRHLKTCKKKKKHDNQEENRFIKLEKTIEKLKEKNKKLKETIKKLEENNRKKTINNTVNNTNSDNTNTEMIEENHELMKTIIYSGINAIPKLVKYMHCNKQYPENINVYINNIKSKYIFVYNEKNGTWELRSQDDVIDSMSFRAENLIDGWKEEFDHSSEILTQYNVYNRLREKPENIKKINEALKINLYNNRLLIKK